MTLLERASVKYAAPTVDSVFADLLRDVLLNVPGAVAMSVSRRPSGRLAFLVIDEQRTDFAAAEEAAYASMARVERIQPDTPIDLVCLTKSEAQRIELDDSAHVYSLQA